MLVAALAGFAWRIRRRTRHDLGLILLMLALVLGALVFIGRCRAPVGTAWRGAAAGAGGLCLSGQTRCARRPRAPDEPHRPKAQRRLRAAGAVGQPDAGMNGGNHWLITADALLRMASLPMRQSAARRG